MPLSCLDPEGRRILSLEFSDEAWENLRRANRQSKLLRFDCCRTPVILRTSSRGLRHFAHRAGGTCTSAPESEAHLYLKAMAVMVAREAGWNAQAEVTGRTPGGEEWRADVLAERGRARVAIEIQLSDQTDDETLERQRRYAASKVRGLWLLRRKNVPICHDLPAAQLGGSLRNGFHVDVTTTTSTQRLTVEEFLAAAFARRLHFGIPRDVGATVSIHAGTMKCWRSQCLERTRVITRIEVEFGPDSCDFTLADIGDYSGLAEAVLAHVPQKKGFGVIKPRYSRTEKRSYLSNGCRACGRLLGAFYLYQALPDEQQIANFPQRLTGPWYDAVVHQLARERAPMAWGVYDHR